MKTASAIILIPAIAAGIWFAYPFTTTETVTAPDTTATDKSTADSAAYPNNPLATKTPTLTHSATVANVQTDSAEQIQRAQDQTAQPPAPTLITDSEFRLYEQRIKSDSQLRYTLLDEFLATPHGSRSRQLAALLGQTDDPRVIQAATDLLYSGQQETSYRALELLARLQPHNIEARRLATAHLAIESDPGLLMASLNTLATPVINNTPAPLLASIRTNLQTLTTHQNNRVRALSIAILGRWGSGDSATPGYEIRQAVTDSDATVRARAVSALRSVPNPDQDVINALLGVAENPDELVTTRQLALYSLKEMPLSVAQRNRYTTALGSVRRRR